MRFLLLRCLPLQLVRLKSLRNAPHRPLFPVALAALSVVGRVDAEGPTGKTKTQTVPFHDLTHQLLLVRELLIQGTILPYQLQPSQHVQVQRCMDEESVVGQITIYLLLRSPVLKTGKNGVKIPTGSSNLQATRDKQDLARIYNTPILAEMDRVPAPVQTRTTHF